MKPVAYILVGLPASGKSTIAEKMLNENSDLFYYSTDAEIQRLSELNGFSYDQGFETFFSTALRTMNENLNNAIQAKQSVLWDQTNLNPKKRRDILNRFKPNGYLVECLCFLPPEEVDDIAEWNHRLNSRPGKTIPDYIMKNMIESYTVPSTDEGFDLITFYDLYANIVEKR